MRKLRRLCGGFSAVPASLPSAVRAPGGSQGSTQRSFPFPRAHRSSMEGVRAVSGSCPASKWGHPSRCRLSIQNVVRFTGPEKQVQLVHIRSRVCCLIPGDRDFNVVGAFAQCFSRRAIRIGACTSAQSLSRRRKLLAGGTPFCISTWTSAPVDLPERSGFRWRERKKDKRKKSSASESKGPGKFYPPRCVSNAVGS
uniref:Uncharacterized protein n=1 Tax=Ixodes ricinus TaxID=34613 RepID=A0A6B0V1B5_IXORI